MMGIGTKGFGTKKRRWKWKGTWYKPWTWFKFIRYWEVDDFRLEGFSFVANPPDPNCVIKESE